MSIDLAVIGQALRDARQRRGLTQRDVARRLGVTPQQVSLVEQGRVKAPIDRLHAHGRIVGVDLRVVLVAPGDPRADLMSRLEATIPELDEGSLETLRAWLDVWERRRAAASRRPPQQA